MPNRSIVIIEDHPVMRNALAAWFRGTGRWRVLGSAATLQAAKDLLSGPAKAAGLVILDIKLESEWGLDLLPWLKARATGRAGGKAAPLPLAAVYTVYSDLAHVNAALSLGAKGYIIKKRDEAELEAALETLLQGGEWIDPEAERPPAQTGSSFAAGNSLAALTKREAEVLSLIKSGLSHREIAAQIGVQPHTAQNIASCVKEKLGITSFKALETR